MSTEVERESNSKTKETGGEQVKWDLSDLYQSPDDPALKEDRESVLDEAEMFAERYKGKVSSLTKEEFLTSLREYEQILQKAGKIGSYAHLIWSTHTEDPRMGKLLQEANELGSEIRQRLVFYDVEWLSLEEDRAGNWIRSDILKPYRHYLETSRYYKPHILEEKQEQILTAKTVTGRSAWNRYFDETMGAARFDLDGKELTEQQVLSKLHNSDRGLRKRAHQSLTRKFKDLSRTLTFIFNTLLADKHTNDKLRGYKSWISSRNLANQTDSDTVDALVQTVTGRYPLVQRYYHLKRKLLGYDDLYDYDRYAPLTKSETTVKWEHAREMVLDAYENFHPEMGKIAGKFFEKNWIDAAIKPGKRGGAYSASTVTSVHPYVFMNYDGQLRDVQTLAHELGHGVHQYLARKQGELQSGTPLTTAETASVFGEMLVFDKLMKRIEDPKEKLALLISKMDDTIATVFRQVSMNRFEDAIHTGRREQGELTTGQFSEKWLQTQKDLYGDAVTLTDEYRLWWCYIPHFLHTPGYVYAYAFGELLVLALYQSYQDQDDGFADRYMEVLEAGGSDWPHNLVSKLGMDIKDPAFWENGLQIFEQMMDQAEELSYKLKG
ncbi:MAG: M3 family oligoendopeptidase [Balneolaceae bacterium]